MIFRENQTDPDEELREKERMEQWKRFELREEKEKNRTEIIN